MLSPIIAIATFFALLGEAAWMLSRPRVDPFDDAYGDVVTIPGAMGRGRPGGPGTVDVIAHDGSVTR